MLLVARGNQGKIVGCIAVEVSVCMGEVSQYEFRALSIFFMISIAVSRVPQTFVRACHSTLSTRGEGGMGCVLGLHVPESRNADGRCDVNRFFRVRSFGFVLF